MATFIDEDFARVHVPGKDGKDRVVLLAWGDEVEIVSGDKKHTKVRIAGSGTQKLEGVIKGELKPRKEGVLKFAMVDVQQGDGMVVETPKGRVMTIDGGDNKLFARYLAGRYRGTSAGAPKLIDAMIVTHGDADHFAGLADIRRSETDKRLGKRIFIRPERVYHNGLVKGPSKKNNKKVPDEEMFGRCVKKDGDLFVVDLHDDLRTVDRASLNRPFADWVECLKHWSDGQALEIRRLAAGMPGAFGFLADEKIQVELHGPFDFDIEHNGKVTKGLPFLHTPSKDPNLPLAPEEISPNPKKRPYSASHTINGHSLAMRFVYKNVRFYLTGDLNQESMQILRTRIPEASMQAEILKVPHHGSADFDLQALRMIAPVVSLISSGDESSKKEHIHPRATVVGALGLASRGPLPLVFCTELAAFFEMRGLSGTVVKKGKPVQYFGFERTNFGIIHVRTDGERVLVFTHSGKAEMKEAYRFDVDAAHNITFKPTSKI